MTDSDNIVGAVGGLIAVGIVANVAGKMIKPVKVKKQKPLNKKSAHKSIW